VAIVARRIAHLVHSIIVSPTVVERITACGWSATSCSVLVYFWHLNPTFDQLLWNTILRKTLHRLLIYDCAGKSGVDTQALFS
jgi:hypothetical protein